MVGEEDDAAVKNIVFNYSFALKPAPKSITFLHECLSKSKNRDKILNLVFFHFTLHETPSLKREGVETQQCAHPATWHPYFGLLASGGIEVG